MSEQSLKICHLYPEVLNLYGDRGNTLCLAQRLKWRGIKAEVVELHLGEKMSITDCDIFFVGGGQDFEQGVLLEDLASGKGADIKAAIEDGKTFLCICGGYQMMGHYYETYDGKRCEFLGAVDLYTKGSETRMIGNYAYKLGSNIGGSSVVGFENHSGKTYLGKGVEPLGTVLKGFGNNGEDKTEGARYNNVFATYSHGPLLPKNARLADELLSIAYERKYGEKLLKLEHEMEDAALNDIMRQLER